MKIYRYENGKTQHKYFKPCDFHKAVEFNIRIREENGYIIREEENN